MTSSRQMSGAFGEQKVVKDCSCPRCKRQRTLRRLPQNFKCADVICDFCGYLAQVKTKGVSDIAVIPTHLAGAAWNPQLKRMDANIYFPLFLVLVADEKRYSIFYLSADLQERAMFQPNNETFPRGRQTGWQGFSYVLTTVRERFIHLR